MTELRFKQEMNRATQMRNLEQNSDRSQYWVGYIRGLRRAYHGENFGTSEEHRKWLSIIDSKDESRKQAGQGYRDGLALSETIKIGRPSVGNATLPALTVPEELKNILEERAREMGESVPDLRRAAYNAYLAD